MIEHLEPWLERWAAWRLAQSERLGYAAQSPIKKMMDEMAPTSKKTYRRRRHFMVMGEGNNVQLVPRDMDHMKCTERRGKRTPIGYQNDTASELMEEAFTHLRREEYKTAILYKYVKEFNNGLSAKTMGIGLGRFKGYVDLAHESIDTYLRTQHQDEYRRIAVDFGFLIRD